VGTYQIASEAVPSRKSESHIHELLVCFAGAVTLKAQLGSKIRRKKLGLRRSAIGREVKIQVRSQRSFSGELAADEEDAGSGNNNESGFHPAQLPCGEGRYGAQVIGMIAIRMKALVQGWADGKSA
jgi:hypothetical protein